MKIPDQFDIPRSEWEKLIDEWIFDEKHRKMLKLNLLDGYTYDELAYEFGMSTRQVSRILMKSKDRLFKRVK